MADDTLPANDDAYYKELVAQGIEPEMARAIVSKITPEMASSIAARVIKGRRTDSTKSEKSPVATPTKSATAPNTVTDIDFRTNKPVPAWVREVIETRLAIEQEDVRKAGQVGFLARALVIASLPYRDQKDSDGHPLESYTRVNGDFKLKIMGGYGIPFGIYPRLLLGWVTTEAVRRQSPEIELGDSLRAFLRDVLDIRSSSGGSRGSGQRVLMQMKRLFGSLITAEYDSSAAGAKGKGFALRNILIANELKLSEEEIRAIEALEDEPGDKKLWTPQSHTEAGTWQSKVVLSEPFFRECINSPVPIDLRAYKALRGSALAMDIYSWLTYRMSYLQTPSRSIPWEALMLQFGSGFTSVTTDPTQAIRNFKKEFLKALKLVQHIYDTAAVSVQDNGLVLYPSPTHVPKLQQGNLF